MVSDWKSITLHDVATLRNGAGVKQAFFTEEPDGVPLIKVSNFTDDSISIAGLTKVDSTHAQQWESHFIENGDVLVATVGSWPPNWSSVVGKVVKAPIESSGAIQNQNTCCIQPSKIVDKKFLYYKLKNRDFLLWVSNVAQGSANQARIPVKQLGKYNFKLPSVTEQKAIAHILGSLDDKIELNRQINETLETMAQALFKSWFVDFDPVIDNALVAGNPIPDELLERAEQRKGIDKQDKLDIQGLFPDTFEFTEEMGWIPKGWKTSTLDDLTTELRRGISPKYTEVDGVRVVNQRCIRNHSIDYSICRLNDANVRKVEGRYLEVGDVLVNSTGVGTLGRMAQVFYLDEPAVVDSHVTVVRPNAELVKPYMFGRLMLSIEPLVESMGLGSTGQTELSRVHLGELVVCIPPIELQESVEKLFSSYSNKSAFNLQQNITLAKLRDTLLPKLMSGELRIPDAAALVDEVL